MCPVVYIHADNVEGHVFVGVSTVFMWAEVTDTWNEPSVLERYFDIWVCFCCAQIATVKSRVGQETFPKTVLRKSSSPGEDS